MRNVKLILAAVIVVISSSGCAAQAIQSDSPVLSEDEVIDLIDNPAKWDGATVTVRVYPYDNGFSESYLLCFEACNSAVAERSPFIVYTSENRFRGYRGDRPVIITARYSSACFYRSTLCPDLRFGQFTEVAQQ